MLSALCLQRCNFICGHRTKLRSMGKGTRGRGRVWLRDVETRAVGRNSALICAFAGSKWSFPTLGCLLFRTGGRERHKVHTTHLETWAGQVCLTSSPEIQLFKFCLSFYVPRCFCLWESLSTTCLQYPRRPEEEVRYLGNTVTDNYHVGVENQTQN